MYFNKKNCFFHGIMFHHFHDNKIHLPGQGSISKKIIKKTGFISVKDNDLFVPNHFEPFEKKKFTINFSYKSDSKNKTFFFFKADGDHDRPNLFL